jgi:hypothetical protein
MKKFMLIGGLLGFLLGVVLGWSQQSVWPVILCRASVMALGAGLLFRWWSGVCFRSLHQAQLERAARKSSTAAPRPVSVPSKL